MHRVIKTIIHNKGHYVPAYGDMGDEDPLTRWRNIGDHCSAAERRADEASRDVEAWLKCQYMKSRIGEQLRGTVTGVAPFGLFITLDALYVEGMVHVSELGAEYFQHNEVMHELRGERTGRRFRLYDSLVVQVARVDLDARRIEFQLVPSMVRTTRASKSAEREQDFFQAPDEEEITSEMPAWLAQALAEAGGKKKKKSKKEKQELKEKKSAAQPKASSAKKASREAAPAKSPRQPGSPRQPASARQPAKRAGKSRKARQSRR